jgi:putative nucleotidyltransferase with HDIG domain
MSEHFISPEQLCVGVHVQLDLGWMSHPFTFSSFKIKSQEQVEVLRRLGLSRIKYDPNKSSAQPLPLRVTPQAAPVEPQMDELISQGMASKARRIEQLGRIRDDIARVEQQFVKVADAIRNATRNLRSNPQAAAHESDAVVKQMVDTLVSGDDITLHVISEKLGEEAYFHSLNVTVLSLMLAKAAELDTLTIHQIGLGAILHDIGKIDVPSIVTLKTGPLTRPEQILMEQHCDYGVKLAQKMNLSDMAMSVILQHHECADGSGYPKKLGGEQITLAARVVAIANSYDNLCNPANVAAALTPSEALAQMFAHKRAKFDDRLLKLFIKRLGIYPPGSIVQLSNEMIGLVVATNLQQPLRPEVMVYDANIPKEEALIISLEVERDIKVDKSLRPSQLPRQVHQYLNPRKNVAYFFDPNQRKSIS